MSTIPKSIQDKIEIACGSEKIYEPKYGGKDHSGYDTMMKYEINYERMDAFENGAKWMYSQLAPDSGEYWKKRCEAAIEEIDNSLFGTIAGADIDEYKDEFNKRLNDIKKILQCNI